MVKLRYKVLSIALILGAVFLWGRCGRKPSSQIPTVLPPNDKEQIIVDPVKHRLTVVQSTGIKVINLPDHPSVIDIHKDGSVVVTAPQYGFEHRFFLGGMVSDQGRFAVGMDLFYWKKLDLGLGGACQVGMHTPVAFLGVSYTIYDNLRIGLTYDNNQRIGGMLTVRI